MLIRHVAWTTHFHLHIAQKRERLEREIEQIFWGQVQKSYVKWNVLVILHWFWNQWYLLQRKTHAPCQVGLDKDFAQRGDKSSFLLGAFSKAVNAQMMTDCMFPRNNRAIYFKKHRYIVTLFLVEGVSASRTKAAPASVLSYCSLY